MRRRILAPTCVLALALVLASVSLTACARAEPEESVSNLTGGPPSPLVIGTLPIEDTLPLWVAEERGLFDEHGLDVEIITFQAAKERDAALAAGQVDAFTGDIIAAARLEAAGTPVTIGTVLLGGTPAEGRFGIVGAPETGYTDLAALAGVPIGTSVGTVQEYVLDGLMRQAGVDSAEVVKEEVAEVQVRFDLLMQGRLKAAALPEPFLTLAVERGAILVAHDTDGENLSQTVLGFSDAYLSEPGGVETLVAILEVWDASVAIINEDPDAWRDLLVEKARLPEPVSDAYTISVYPRAQVPTAEQVGAVLSWMTARSVIQTGLTYEDLVLVTP